MPVSSSRPADCRPNGPSFEVSTQQAQSAAEWLRAVRLSDVPSASRHAARYLASLPSFPHLYPTVGAIAAELGLTRRPTQCAIRALETAGLLQRRARHGQSRGEQRSNALWAFLPSSVSARPTNSTPPVLPAAPIDIRAPRGRERAEQRTDARERAAGGEPSPLPALGFPKDRESPSAGPRGPSRAAKVSVRPELPLHIVARLEKLPHGLDAAGPILRAGVDPERAVSRLEAAQPRHAGRYVHSVIKGLEVEQMCKVEAEEASKHDYQPEPEVRVRKSAAEKLNPSPKPHPVPSPRGAPQLADRFLAVLADKRRALSGSGG